MSSQKIALLKKHLFQVGGLEKQTWRIAQAFEESGCDVTLISNDAKGHDAYAHRPVQRFDAALLNDYDIVLGIDRLPFQTHIRAGNGVHAAYLSSRGKRLPYLMPKHRAHLQMEKEALLKPTLRHIITNSQMVKEDYIRHYAIDPEKITPIHNGVEHLELFEDFKKSLDRPLSPYHLLFVGNDFKRKGLLPLLHALSHLRKKEWKLTVVGTDKRENGYHTLAEGLGLKGRVHFAKQCDPLPYYRQADCLVLPTQYDPFANVTLEALSMGLFVITTPYNGASEVLTKDSGVVIDSAVSLKEAIAVALVSARNPQAIRDSVERLDFSHQLKKFVDVCLRT